MGWKSRWARYWYRGATEVHLGGLPVRWRWLTIAERETALVKLRDAFELLGKVPKYQSRLMRHTRGIFLFPTEPAVAQWHQSLGLIVLSYDYVARGDVDALDLAATMVHEATHGWLASLGIPQQDNAVPRIETVCIGSEVLFARRFDGGGAFAEAAIYRLQRDPSFYSRAAQAHRELEALREVGVPGWVVAALRLLRRQRAA